jgi:CheY-like chemotaxis protein
MMLSGVLPESERARGISVIDRNSQTLKRLINDLLDMSAILSGKMRIEEAPVFLAGVVREAVETVRPQAAEKDIDLQVEFSNWEDPVVVKGDRTRLVQTFWNLLTNAVKFTPRGGSVQVRCEANSAEAVIEVDDNGEGIAEDFLPHVFERFRQADGSKTRTHGGLGLGLALVDSFVKAHGGTTEVDSEGPGHGSTFIISLPRFTVNLPPVVIEPSASEATPDGAHLLIVEDAQDTLELMQATLNRRGYTVTSCVSAATALEVCATEEFDLIISDIGMPVMDGYELITRLRRDARFSNTPAIAISGYASQKDKAAALAAGFDIHLAKPLDPGELVALVAKLLKQKRDDNNIDSA